jgi:phenylpropionate dioxygenase-like ring-hydroxylating dioxygenase large terminal subunit
VFLKNAWYVAAWGTELDSEPLGRTLLDVPVVLYRMEDGRPVGLENRCCHRSLPLSMGVVRGDQIECGYHGLRFAADGQCIAVPGQSLVPPGAAVRSFPLVERWGWVWIWMGDPSLADDSLIPDWWFMGHPEWKVIPGNGGKPLYTRGNYELVTDNLLDLSHVGYVHPDTIGTDDIVEFPINTERRTDRVRVIRLMPDVVPPPFHKFAGDFEGRVDRWMIVEARVPCYIDVDVGSAEVGSGVLEGNRLQGIAYHALNVPTPETATTTHFFYGHARLFKTDSEEVDAVYRRNFYKIFKEDVDVIEAQQAAIDRAPDRTWIDINVDAPGLAMRALLRRRIEEEVGARKRQ